MIKHNPRLSFKDRLIVLKRAIKLVLDKDTQYVNLLWVNPNESQSVHTIYAAGTDPIDPFLAYMAKVAGKSETLDDVNKRIHYYLDKVTVAYAHHTGTDLDTLAIMANPIKVRTDDMVPYKPTTDQP